jgi:hypothetical protein
MKPKCTNLCHEGNIKIGWYTPSDGARDGQGDGGDQKMMICASTLKRRKRKTK